MGKWDALLGWVRENAPDWAYDALGYGWCVLALLTFITVLDMIWRLMRSDHGMKP